MHRTIPLLLIGLLTGCAAAMPGYSPPSASKVPPALQPFKEGKVEGGGQYVPSEAERGLTCAKLTGSMQVIMSRLDDSGNRPRPGATAGVMQQAIKPFQGQGADLNVDHEITQAKARLRAYNALLAEKKCKTLDISKY